MRRLLAAIALLAWLEPSPAGALGPGEAGDAPCHDVHTLGRATDPATGRLLYTEEHRERLCHDHGVTRLVVYRDAVGDTVIVKHVDFSRSATTPDLDFEDRRSGYAETVRVRADSLVLGRRRDRGSPFEHRTVTIHGVAVVDAGFDRIIRQSWEQLVAGEKIEVYVAVPDKLRGFRFRIRRRGAGPPGAALQLRVEPASFWLRLVAPHVDVTYDVQRRRLLTYEGITDVPGPTRRRYRARVEFSYPSAPAAGQRQGPGRPPL